MVTIPTIRHPYANPGCGNVANAFSTVTLNGSGHQVALILRAPKTGSIRKIGFKLSALVTPTDTDFRVETVSAGFPTGTLFGTDTNAVIASGSLVSGMNMATLTADAAVTANDLIAIVVAPSGSPNISVDRYIPTTAGLNMLPYLVSYSGSWGISAVSTPVVAIEYSDGSYAYTPDVLPISAANAHTFDSSSTPDEIGAKFRLPVSMRVSGGWLAIDLDNDCEVVLYGSDGVTPLATSSTLTSDGRFVNALCGGFHFMFPTPATVPANEWCYFVVKPGASSISLASLDVPSAAAMDQLSGGQNWHFVSAKDPSGVESWTATTTRYPLMGLLIDGIEAGSATPTSSQENQMAIPARPMRVLGSQMLTVDNTEGGVALTLPAVQDSQFASSITRPSAAYLYVEDADIRWTMDPAVTVKADDNGHAWAAGSGRWFIGTGNLEHFRAIRTGDTDATLSITYFA